MAFNQIKNDVLVPGHFTFAPKTELVLIKPTISLGLSLLVWSVRVLPSPMSQLAEMETSLGPQMHHPCTFHCIHREILDRHFGRVTMCYFPPIFANSSYTQFCHSFWPQVPEKGDFLLPFRLNEWLLLWLPKVNSTCNSIVSKVFQ